MYMILYKLLVLFLKKGLYKVAEEEKQRTRATSTSARSADQKKISRMRYPSLHSSQEVLLQASSNLVPQTGADTH